MSSFKKEASFAIEGKSRMCRLDADSGEIEVSGMEKERCRRILKTLLEND